MRTKTGRGCSHTSPITPPYLRRGRRNAPGPPALPPLPAPAGAAATPPPVREGAGGVREMGRGESAAEMEMALRPDSRQAAGGT